MSLEELDEHERSERVREWVRKNIGSIALGLVAGIGAIYGLEQWNHHRQRNAGLAGDDYRAYAEAVTKKDATAVATLGKSLRDKYPDSPYASMVALNDAATATSEGKTDAALASLEWAEAHATMPEVKTLAMLRRARLLVATGKAEAALELAKKIDGEGFKPLAAEVRGDALLALKRNSEAIGAYDEALVGLDSGAARRSIVEMKRDDLAGVKAGS
ncbi:MAG: tetratricopeptide repeat protein [Rhodanobacteraceae bacterium]|jgi:predicted negative regulator of RcsB-dependent stress response|nr:tetratricopeptide repeat protein [Rhodanobacteraceae bacterium]MBL0041461.1 tetratricopeptide repeat protein [Xanthomonadales bacterium]MBP6078921.1 tetratricopeptide repeat protein [Xanthomonadales bacterium]MBP7623359.1 tetratricopeptide repeat protein [Xanthomonadales bacterium]